MWGLALIASHLAAVVTIGVLASRYQQNMLATERLRGTSTLAEQFAGRIAPLLADDKKLGTVRILTRALARDAGLAYVAVTLPGGKVVAHSEPGWIGRPWTPTASDAVQPQRRDAGIGEQSAVVEFSAPAVAAAGQVAGYVRIGRTAEAAGEATQVLWTIVAATAVVVLAFLLLMYRSLRRSMVPLTGVRDNLLAFSSGTERDLRHLKLSSTLGQVAGAWNDLVDFTDELESTVAQLKTQTALTPVFERYQQQRYRDVLDAVPAGVLWIGADERLVYANARAKRLLQLSDDVPEDVRLSELPINPVARDVIGSLAQARGDASDVDLSIGEAPQQTVVRLSAAGLGGAGADDGVVILLGDVSQQKEADRARDDFLHHIAHELRTPLTNIRAYSETLLHDLVDDPEMQKECFNVINSETMRLSRLIEQILSVSQLEVGTAIIKMGEVRLDKLLRDAVQDVQAEADRKNIDLLLKMPPKTPHVRADRDQIATVLINLLGNAVKYTQEGGQVELVCEVTDESVNLSVSDTGIGISADQSERIFEKFYRVEDDYVATQTGTGLGLAISREIVRLHGSDIAVESTPGTGSRFSLSLSVTADG